MNKRNGAGRAHKTIVILLLVVILLLAAISCVLAMQLFERNDPSLNGSWQMQLDLTETVRARANAWLRKAELGEMVDVSAVLPQIRVAVLLKLSGDGSWSRSVDEASYLSAKSEVDEAMAASLRELIVLRIAEAGRGAENAETAELHFEKALGMSSRQYFSDRGPVLLPTLEELRALYNGGGAYQADGRRIRFDDGAAADYLADDRMLALSDGERTEVYVHAGY